MMKVDNSTRVSLLAAQGCIEYWTRYKISPFLGVELKRETDIALKGSMWGQPITNSLIDGLVKAEAAKRRLSSK
jgi:hypothetical protein